MAPRYSYPSYIGILADVIMKLFHVYVFDCSCRETCVFKLTCAFVNYVSFSAMFSSTFGVRCLHRSWSSSVQSDPRSLILAAGVNGIIFMLSR